VRKKYIVIMSEEEMMNKAMGEHAESIAKASKALYITDDSLFLAGMFFLLLHFVYAPISGDDSLRTLQWMTYPAYLFLLAGFILNLVLDCMLPIGRPVKHGRWGGFSISNMIHASLGIAAVAFEIFSFMSEVLDESTDKGFFNGKEAFFGTCDLLAGFCWVGSSLVIFSRWCGSQKFLDKVGNVVYAVATVCALIAAYLLKQDTESGFGTAMRVIALVLWNAAGVLFLLTNCYDFKPGSKKGGGDEEEEVDDDDDE
jgi:hypothetical protein